MAGITYYVDGVNGDDENNGLAWETAFKTIQTGLDAADDTGDTVIVADGTYTGDLNKNLDFGGKAIHLKSVGGVANCIIDCELSGRGFWFHNSETDVAIVEGFTIQNGRQSKSYGGGIYCESNSCPVFIDCVISSNFANDGAGILCDAANPTFINCVVANNFAGTLAGDGGGIVCWNSSNPMLINCVIFSNSANASAGGIWCVNSSPEFINCTISNNSAVGYGGGVLLSGDSDPIFQNCIIWGNTAGTAGHQIYSYDSSASVTLSYSCYANGANDIAGTGTVTPTNCITANPRFVDSANSNYRLRPQSQAINAGSNALIPEGTTTDLDGGPRVRNSIVDIGAYENVITSLSGINLNKE